MGDVLIAAVLGLLLFGVGSIAARTLATILSPQEKHDPRHPQHHRRTPHR